MPTPLNNLGCNNLSNPCFIPDAILGDTIFLINLLENILSNKPLITPGIFLVIRANIEPLLPAVAISAVALVVLYTILFIAFPPLYIPLADNNACGACIKLADCADLSPNDNSDPSNPYLDDESIPV